MKRLSSVFLVAFGFMLFASCTKKKELVFIIEGSVYDKSTGQNANAGKVSLYKVPVATTQEILIEEKNISDGTYKFNFPRDMSERYVVKYQRENYFQEVNQVYFSQFEVGKAYTLNFSAEAIAYMNWIFVDELPLNPNFSVIMQKLNGRPNGEGTCPNQEYEYFGSTSPDTLRCAVGGNQYIRFYMIKLPNVVLDSVYCPSFQETFFNVSF